MAFTYTFILGSKNYELRNEYELALTLELLAETPNAPVYHWNIIMSLDTQLEGLIQTYKGLALCLKHLNHKNRFLLLVKIGDVLPQVIGSSWNFANILARIPEESDKIRLIKQIRKRGLEKMIFTAYDFANMLEWLYGDGQRIALETLGDEYLRRLVVRGEDAYVMLQFLSKEHKTMFIEMVGMEHLRRTIHSPGDFNAIFKGLTDEYSEKLLEELGNDMIEHLFLDNKQFRSTLLRLSSTKEKLLIKFMKHHAAGNHQ